MRHTGNPRKPITMEKLKSYDPLQTLGGLRYRKEGKTKDICLIVFCKQTLYNICIIKEKKERTDTLFCNEER